MTKQDVTQFQAPKQPREKAALRRMLTERRRFDKDSMDYEWRTRAARKYVWMLRGVPVLEWPQ